MNWEGMAVPCYRVGRRLKDAFGWRNLSWSSKLRSRRLRVGYRVAKCRPWNITLKYGWSVFGQRLFRQTRVARDRKTGRVSKYMFHRSDSGLVPHLLFLEKRMCVSPPNTWQTGGQPS